MKKQLFILTALFILTTGMAGCDKEERKKEGKKIGIINLDNGEYITMQVSPEKIPLNSTNINLVIANQTDKTILCERSYSIDGFNNKVWGSVYSYNEPTFIGLQSASAKETVEIPINLETEQYIYKIGKYRINYQVHSNGHAYDICAEFEIY